MQGRKDINDEEKLNKGNKEEIKQTDNRDVVVLKANPHTYIIIRQYRCFYIVKGMLLKGKITAFRV